MSITSEHPSPDEFAATATVTSYIASVQDEGERFARAAETGDLDVPVVDCPGWTMGDLVCHLGEIHLWAAANVAFPTPTWLNVSDLEAFRPYWPELVERPSGRDDLVAWYRSTHLHLLDVLRSAPADVAAFTFLPAPTPLTMWARRQASEIAIHRYDAERARGLATAYEAAFAADMVDELLSGFAPYYDLSVDETRVLHVVACDVDEQWWVVIAPSGVSTRRCGVDADLTIAGNAADLYVALWNRTPASSLELVGDADLLAVWRNGCRVEWSR